MNHFKRIVVTPHCSLETGRMKEMLTTFARQHGFLVHEDEAGNLLCQKGNPTLCLQSHYDMVCMGDAPTIELVEKDGWLKAKNSSLGADNGMGMAIMMAMMERHENLECLFTNDEEVGLIGANNLTLQIHSSRLLNLDSEEENGVFIGCAGGVDIFGTMALEWENIPEGWGIYEMIVDNLPGGHSGVDIAKNIPSALKILGSALVENECVLLELEGGERNNSIPKRARALVASKNVTCKDERVKVMSLETNHRKYLAKSGKIIHMINAFAQGVRSFDTSLNIPRESINLSMIRQHDAYIEVEFFARAMQQAGIDRLKSETYSLLSVFDFEVRYDNECAPWQPNEGAFARQVADVARDIWGEVRFMAIHAGLECGVIVEKQDHPVEVCSIGPCIEFPHSVRERCELASIERVTHIVDRLLQER